MVSLMYVSKHVVIPEYFEYLKLFNYIDTKSLFVAENKSKTMWSLYH